MEVFRASGSAPANPHLLRAMAAMAKQDNEVNRRAYYQALLTSKFLVPVSGEAQRIPTPDGKGGFTQNFIMLKGTLGQLFMLAFTDREALQCYRSEGVNAAIVPGQTLFSIAVNNKVEYIVINHTYDTGSHLERREIETLAEGLIPSTASTPVVPLTVPGDAPRTIEPPPPLSQEMLAALRGVLAESGIVTRAYLFRSAIGMGTPHLALGIGLDEYADMMVLEGDMLRAVDEKLAPFFEVA